MVSSDQLYVVCAINILTTGPAEGPRTVGYGGGEVGGGALVPIEGGTVNHMTDMYTTIMCIHSQTFDYFFKNIKFQG